MRSNSAAGLIVLLVTTCVVSAAAAQGHGRAGFAGARHFSAPAPHFSAPGSRFFGPRFSAPGPYFPARVPRNAAPQMTVPRMGAPQFAAPSVNAPEVAPLGRAALTPGTAPANAIGQEPVTGNREGTASLQSVISSRSGAPILRNPAYANLATRDPANRALAQSTFAGGFARSGLASAGDQRRRRYHFGRVIGFLGPVFWPYAYDDFFDYTFSPYAYDTFWPNAYDDVLDGIYGAYAPDYADNATDSGDPAAGTADVPGGTAYVYGDGTSAWVMRGGSPSGAAAPAAGATQICSGKAKGLTDFPVQRIAQQVKPSPDQQALLDDLKAATTKALDDLRAACPDDLPSTPTGRLAAVRSRVEAMLRAVHLIEPALQKFYGALSDEQKERLNVLDADTRPTGDNRQADPTQLCGEETPAANLPIGAIEQGLRLSDAQQTDFNALKEASLKVGDILKANCPNEPALTPPTRLARMKQRLEAMLQVLDTVQPALVNFYGSLDDEQKARFNRLGARGP